MFSRIAFCKLLWLNSEKNKLFRGVEVCFNDVKRFPDISVCIIILYNEKKKY